MKQFALYAFAFCLLGAGQAFAHAQLKGAHPGVGATVSAPRTISLEFSEGVVPSFSGVTLRDGSGKSVTLGKPANAGGRATLAAPVLGSLQPGTYTVTWHAVSVDTHRTQGSFRFTVAP